MVIALWHHGVLGSLALKPVALDSRTGAGMSSFKVVGSESACLKMELSVSTSRSATPSLASVMRSALLTTRYFGLVALLTTRYFCLVNKQLDPESS